MNSMHQRQSGFTLIELVMVIVILGILAAFAFPRFANLSGDARTASVQGLSGAIKSASAIVHSKWLISGLPASAASVTLEGTTISLAFGYPDVAGIKTAAQLSSSDWTSGTTSPVTFTPAGYTGANCLVTYTEATAVNSAPTIVVDTTGGCN